MVGLLMFGGAAALRIGLGPGKDVRSLASETEDFGAKCASQPEAGCAHAAVEQRARYASGGQPRLQGGSERLERRAGDDLLALRRLERGCRVGFCFGGSPEDPSEKLADGCNILFAT